MDRNRRRWQPCRLCSERLPRGRLRPFCGVEGIHVLPNDHLVSRVIFVDGFPTRVDQSWIEPLPLVCRDKERCQARRCEAALLAGALPVSEFSGPPPESERAWGVKAPDSTGTHKG